MLNQEQLREFAKRGFLVLPQAVPEDLVTTASGLIDELIEREPPGPEIRGPHNYFPKAVEAPALSALLMGSPAFSLAESLTGPGTLEVPWQVQVALNIPPFSHRPGMHHIDGAPHEPDGRPGTFTLLAGILMSDRLDEDVRHVADPVSAILWFLHKIFGTMFGPDNGFAWALSVLFLVFFVRALLLKPAISQLRAARTMQKLAPDIQKLREKYQNDRQRMAQELQKLQVRARGQPTARLAADAGADPGLPVPLPAAAQFPSLGHTTSRCRHQSVPLRRSGQEES